MRDQLVQMSPTHSCFDKYCITDKTISHRAAAAPDPEVRRECPMTKLQLCPSNHALASEYCDSVTVRRVLVWLIAAGDG